MKYTIEIHHGNTHKIDHIESVDALTAISDYIIKIYPKCYPTDIIENKNTGYYIWTHGADGSLQISCKKH
jgi:hypothetical protein